MGRSSENICSSIEGAQDKRMLSTNERQDETQFTTKNDGSLSFPPRRPPFNASVFFLNN
jgi:hypothetical protein